jgi:hypothetical protein
MKNIFKRLMNFLLIIFIGLGLGISFVVFEMEFINNFVFGFLLFLGFIGGLNYVFFDKFTLWNKKDETV